MRCATMGNVMALAPLTASRAPQSWKRQKRKDTLSNPGSFDELHRKWKLVSRNSFLDLHRPDLAKVELLQDVKCSQDYINRMIAHDIAYKGSDGDSDDLIQPEEPCCRALGLVKKLTAVARKKKKCCVACPCCRSIKTVNSIAERYEDHPECNFNENANAPTANNFMGNMKCVFGGQQFPKISSSFRVNTNSATWAPNSQRDIKMKSPEWPYFQAANTFPNCPFPAAATPLSHYRRASTINKTTASFVMK